MKKNLLIVFAMPAEAQSSIEKLQCTDIVPNRIYRFKQGWIVISGMGCLAASSAVSSFGRDIDEIWNFGAAGSLNPNLALGHVAEISVIIKNPILPDQIDIHSSNLHARLFPSIKTNQKGLALISSDYPIHHPELNQRLCQHADLVDMEGYGIAFAAQQLNLPLRMWKNVSDFANPQGPRLIEDRLKEISQALATSLENSLRTIL